METLLAALVAFTLFGSVVWFWIATVFFLAICFYADVKENGFIAFFILLALSVLFYFNASIPSLDFINVTNGLIYLVIGFVYSMLRAFFGGRKVKNEHKDLPAKKTGEKDVYNNQEYYLKEYIRKLKGHVARWMFMWPFSMINWAITDLVRDVWDYLYSKISGFFSWIVELGFNSVK